MSAKWALAGSLRGPGDGEILSPAQQVLGTAHLLPAAEARATLVGDTVL